MNKKYFSKRIVALAISLVLVLGVISIPTIASGYGDKGYDTTLDNTYTIDGNNLFVYITGNGGTVTRISGGDDDSVQQYRAVADENWEFAYWSTYYYGPVTQNANPVATLGYYYFSKPGDKDTTYDKTNPVIQVNEEVFAAGVYYLQAIFKPKVTINLNRYLFGSAKSIRGTSPATHLDNVFISGDMGYVPYGADVNVTLTAFTDKYIIESISVHDGAPRNDFTYGVDIKTNVLSVNFTATRPTNVTINVDIKEQNISFNANGGNGTMTTQVFQHSEPSTLTPNSFSRVGYTFAGWNTLANGEGTSYSDKQSLTFSPTNDGDSITLYAQWTACTNHQWENGVCTDCGLTCSHSGGNATCKQQAKCEICGEKYGTFGNHNYVYSMSDNIITETCICEHSETATLNAPNNTFIYDGTEKTGATVTYSQNWKGGDLTVNYKNNINAGQATANITKNTATATVNYSIAAAEPNVKAPTGLTAKYGDTLATVKLPDNWQWKEPTKLVGDAGSKQFSAYYIPIDTNFKTITVDLNLTVAKAEQATPQGLSKTDETVPQKADGTITGLSTNMEYRKEGETTYSAVNSATLENLAPSTYYIRYAKDKNHNPSPDAKITIKAAFTQDVPDTSVKEQPETPQTEDKSNLLMWISVMFVSVSCLVYGALIQGKRRIH